MKNNNMNSNNTKGSTQGSSKGKNQSKRALLNRIRQLEFAAIDLNLYLDNFPNNSEALNAYNNFSRQLISSIQEYEKYYGPLVNFGFSQGSSPWNWIDEPWPWEPEK
jgi:spore coat protein JB